MIDLYKDEDAKNLSTAIQEAFLKSLAQEGLSINDIKSLVNVEVLPDGKYYVEFETYDKNSNRKNIN